MNDSHAQKTVNYKVDPLGLDNLWHTERSTSKRGGPPFPGQLRLQGATLKQQTLSHNQTRYEDSLPRTM